MRQAGAASLTVLALIAFGGIARARETVSPSLRAVLEAHLCEVQELLLRIHRTDDPDMSARHLIIEPADHPEAYVQCRFEAGDSRMQCEAASGYYPVVEDGPPRPHPGDAAALAALGFRSDPKGNDAQDLALGEPPDLERAARLMLRALHDGYGFRKPTELFLEAPLAKGPSRPLPGCAPVS